MSKYRFFCFLIGLLLGLSIGVILCYVGDGRKDTKVVITRIDTMRIVEPSPTRIDTMYKRIYVPLKKDTIFSNDTIIQSDSIFVYLPFERKVYEDSSYTAVVSGYKPSLDDIIIRNKETIIYKEREPKNLSPFVSAGIGLHGDVSVGGGLFFKEKHAIGAEFGNRGVKINYIHKF